MPDHCPRCEHPTAHVQAGVTGAAIDHDRAAQARTCIVLDDDGETFSLYYHLDEHLEAGPAPPAAPDDVPDPMDLSGPHARVFRHVLEATATDGAVREAELVGKAIDIGVPPDEVRDVARDLVDGGYVESPADAVYKAREGVSM